MTGETEKSLPLICILDPSIATTGALMAARREAAVMADKARFILILPEENAIPDERLPEFERVVRVPFAALRRSAASLASYGPRLIVAGKRLKSLLGELGCDRLQVNDFYLPQTWIARRMGFRGTIATWIRFDPRRQGLAARWWLGRAQAASDTLVAVSRFIASAVPPEIAPRIVHDPAPMVETVMPSGQNFLFVGNFIEGKGQDVALVAFQSFAAEYPGAALTFVGSTMGLEKNRLYRQSLEAAASRGDGATRVHFLDHQDELAPFYADALAAVNCSRNESFSFTCLEASARGLPVIATRSGGPQEIVVDEVSGFLVPVGDHAKVAACMKALLNDPALAQSMGAQGARLVASAFPQSQFRDALADIFAL